MKTIFTNKITKSFLNKLANRHVDTFKIDGEWNQPENKVSKKNDSTFIVFNGDFKLTLEGLTILTETMILPNQIANFIAKEIYNFAHDVCIMDIEISFDNYNSSVSVLKGPKTKN